MIVHVVVVCMGNVWNYVISSCSRVLDVKEEKPRMRKKEKVTEICRISGHGVCMRRSVRSQGGDGLEVDEGGGDWTRATCRLGRCYSLLVGPRGSS